MRRHRPSPSPAAARGVSLLELCVALGLVALLAGLAAPGFRVAWRTAAVRAASVELMAGLQHVRSSAILEARPGGLCPSDGGACLPASSAARGWSVWLEDAASTVPLRDEALPPGIVLRATRSPVHFWPHARAASTGTLTICDEHAIAAPRAIVISQSGRARLAAASPGACLS